MVKNTEGMERSEISRSLKTTRSLRLSKVEGKSGVFESLRHRNIEPQTPEYGTADTGNTRSLRLSKGEGKSEKYRSTQLLILPTIPFYQLQVEPNSVLNNAQMV
jgi:hypothetical protein